MADLKKKIENLSIHLPQKRKKVDFSVTWQYWKKKKSKEKKKKKKKRKLKKGKRTEIFVNVYRLTQAIWDDQ